MSQRKEIRDTPTVSERFEYSFIQSFAEEFDERTAEKVDEFYSEDHIVPVKGTEEEKYRRARPVYRIYGRKDFWRVGTRTRR